ncbi:MAG: flagellar basal body-associated protein FliL [Mycobacterium leprae]
MSRGLMITLVSLLVVLVLGVGGLGYYVIFMKSPTVAPTAAKEPTVTDATFVKLDHFVTDLADKSPVHYVDVTIQLAVADKTTSDSVTKVQPVIRDIIVGQLRQRTAADLAGATGKDKLAVDLKAAIGQVVGAGLQKVYITDLVIQ